MLPGKTYTSPTGTVQITCNYPWTITVTDSTTTGPHGKPAGYLWNTTDSVNLTQPFKLHHSHHHDHPSHPGNFCIGQRRDIQLYGFVLPGGYRC